MKTVLNSLTDIFSGVYVKPHLDGQVYYIQARDITAKHEFAKSIEPLLTADGRIDKHFLQAGDILIAAKGRDHYAIEYKGYPSPAVASSIFIVVRIKEKEKLSPSFLQWYVNLSMTQKILTGGAQGSVVPVISKADLESLVIDVPSMEKQSYILKIYELRQHEEELIAQIELLKRKKIEQELLNAISN